MYTINNTKEILEMAYKAFDEGYRDDDIRLIGVRLTSLTNNSSKQLSLFEETQESAKQDDKVQTTIDEINNKFGKSLVKPASLKLVGEGHAKKKYNQ